MRLAERALPNDLRSKVSTSDLVQETMLGACRDFDQFGGTTESQWRAWLESILVHKSRRFLREFRGSAKRAVAVEVPLCRLAHRPGREPNLVDPSAIPPIDALIETEEGDAVSRSMERLDRRERRVVTMRISDELSWNEIASSLHCSISAAHKTLVHALDHLRREVKADLEGRGHDDAGDKGRG
jgi:RNA polymerase sigma-70 factor (ECF subfamily)